MSKDMGAVGRAKVKVPARVPPEPDEVSPVQPTISARPLIPIPARKTGLRYPVRDLFPLLILITRSLREAGIDRTAGQGMSME
ncbi:hypothetical protein AB0O64_35225 [Streptomyces sp. NPDC088341]|uniref:hypothetical protein n=1 Tax=Streptomyces sp. NPDC088341 TaxID=3154870 RepID=UPI00344603ED